MKTKINLLFYLIITSFATTIPMVFEFEESDLNKPTEERLGLELIEAIKNDADDVDKISKVVDLINKGASVSIKNDEGETAIGLALEHVSSDENDPNYVIANALIKAGAVNTRDGQGSTPLMIATLKGLLKPKKQYQKIIELLIKYNAKIDVKDKLNRTAKLIADKILKMKRLSYNKEELQTANEIVKMIDQAEKEKKEKEYNKELDELEKIAKLLSEENEN